MRGVRIFCTAVYCLWAISGGKFWRNSQEFLETESINLYPQKYIKSLTKAVEFLDKIRGISQKNLFSREIPRKFTKASHQSWVGWGNSSVLQPGNGIWYYIGLHHCIILIFYFYRFCQRISINSTIKLLKGPVYVKVTLKW